MFLSFSTHYCWKYLDIYWISSVSKIYVIIRSLTNGGHIWQNIGGITGKEKNIAIGEGYESHWNDIG
jgi:hypothetical protein